MLTTTTFDVKARYIFLPVFIKGIDDEPYEFDAILDTGAPRTEFSDTALQHVGFLNETKKNVLLKPGIQTQKYGKIILPQLEICGHPVNNLEVYVSHFEKSWGIKALIGLDFFRHFKVTVDYSVGQIITAPFKH